MQREVILQNIKGDCLEIIETRTPIPNNQIIIEEKPKVSNVKYQQSPPYRFF